MGFSPIPFDDFSTNSLFNPLVSRSVMSSLKDLLKRLFSFVPKVYPIPRKKCQNGYFQTPKKKFFFFFFAYRLAFQEKFPLQNKSSPFLPDLPAKIFPLFFRVSFFFPTDHFFSNHRPYWLFFFFFFFVSPCNLL